MNITVKIIDTGLRAWADKAKELKGYNVRALKKVGYKYRKMLAREIYQGKPGGQQWPNISIVRRRQRIEKGLRGRATPYSALSKIMGYEVKESASSARLNLGLVKPRSASWAAIAKMMVNSAMFPVTMRLRELFGKYGGAKGKRAKTKKSYSLRKETQMLRRPARGYVEQFIRAHGGQMVADYQRYYAGYLTGKSGKQIGE